MSLIKPGSVRMLIRNLRKQKNSLNKKLLTEERDLLRQVINTLVPDSRLFDGVSTYVRIDRIPFEQAIQNLNDYDRRNNGKINRSVNYTPKV